MGLQTLSSRVNDPQNTFVLTVGMMNGGTQSNIIADEVELVGTTRAFDKAFPNGEGYETRIPLFSHCQNKYTHMWKKNNDGQSLPRVGKVASEASRIGF